MAIRTRDELLASIRERIGEDSGDEALALLEDVTDTFDDLTEKAKDITDWKAEAERIDAEWRAKYKERFFSADVKPEDDPDDAPVPDSVVSMSFDELFEERKD